MPLIDLKSQYALKRVTTQVNTITSAVENHAKRLADFLLSPRGVIFAAKQVALEPETATKRLAAIMAQVALPIPGLHIRSGQPKPTTYPTAYGAASISPQGLDQKKKYYHNKGVKADIDHSVFVDGDDLSELDIVPFYFTTYSLTGGEVAMGRSLAFRAFFSSIQDTTTGNWSSFNYTGRGEAFYVYGSRARNMNFSFKVAAFNYEQLQVMHEKVKVLKSFTSPTYNTNGYMQGNFFKLTIGDYIKSTPGIINSVGVTIASESPWEVGERTTILPHVMDISIEFTVLEDTTPQASFFTDEEVAFLNDDSNFNSLGIQ